MLLSAVAIFPAAIGIGNWPWAAFGKLLFAWSLKMWAIERMAMACSLGVPHVLLGLLQFMNMWFSCFLFNGIAVPVGDVTWPFRVFCYVLPYRWAQTAVTFLSMADAQHWSGAHRCDAATGLAVDGPTALLANATVSFCNPTADDDGHGFYCPSLLSPACFGRTGKQVRRRPMAHTAPRAVGLPTRGLSVAHRLWHHRRPAKEYPAQRGVHRIQQRVHRATHRCSPL